MFYTLRRAGATATEAPLTALPGGEPVNRLRTEAFRQRGGAGRLGQWKLFRVFQDLSATLFMLASLVVTAPVMTYGLIILHEAAHALAARLLRLQLFGVEIGGGPAFRAFWIRDVLITLRTEPQHGFVTFVQDSGSWFRMRRVLVCLAGPLANWLALAALAVAWMVLPSPREVGVVWWMPALWIGTAVAAVFAVRSLLPLDVRLGEITVPSDVKHVLQMLRLRDAQLDSALAEQRTLLAQQTFWREFVRGRIEAALEISRDRIRSSTEDWGALIDHSIAVMARDGVVAALATHAEAEAAFHKWREKVEDHRLVRIYEDALIINRAYYLAHTESPADLQKADVMLTDLRKREGFAAAIRTHGLVQLRRGDLRHGMALLRRAWRMEEPIWLRALCAAYIAYGHALRDEMQQASRWLKRARRLHGSNPLLPIYERWVSESQRARR